ncbi:MAG TPA: hypothetical protein VG052_18980 [Puia sp.]|nr:hypothetical protein [Puia sp.]
MKTTIPGSFAIGKIAGTLLLILFFRGLALSQATAMLKWGNSYVNLSKKTVGGPVQPGDTLEIRTNFYVNKNYNGTGMMYDVRYLDNIPTNTTILPNDSLRLITNEGKTFRRYTYATGDDAGSYVLAPPLPGDFQVRINIGATATITTGADPMGILNLTGTSSIHGNVSKPMFSSGTILVTAFRVVVNAGTLGDTITLGAGQIRYRTTVGAASDTVLNATQYKILISSPTTLCSSSTSTNFAAEFGGTFGHGVGRNRNTPPTFLIPNYTYLPNSATVPSINDGYYGICNNTSPVSSTYPFANRQNTCGGATGIFACANREFGGFWYIGGDHTGTTTAAGNPPPDSTTDAGYMLIVNADLATSEAYHQVIGGLCPNTYYQFSAWMKNICPNCGIDSNSVAEYTPGVLPNLTLVVDSIDRISSGNLDTVGWQQKGFVFLTGPTETSITISIRNNAPGGGGNDWALDDISLATCPPNLLLTPDKPDTLCEGADDTVKFAISAFVNNYTHFILNKSTDMGVTWVPAGLDTLNHADTGTVVPTYSIITGLYTDTVIRYFRVPPATALTIYQLVVASTVGNLASTNCAYATTQPKYVYGVNCFVALPTTLVSFKGQLQNNGLGNLQWTSAGEVPGLQFVVERSDDGIHYNTIGSVPGTAPEGGGATYQFTDPTPVASQSYYRIQLVSNSFSQYSSQVLLSNGSIRFNVRSVLNPFVDHINVELTAPGSGMAAITLIDMYGRYIRRISQPISQGLNSLTIDGLGNLANATYALQIQYGDQLVSEKLVKVAP